MQNEKDGYRRKGEELGNGEIQTPNEEESGDKGSWTMDGNDSLIVQTEALMTMKPSDQEMSEKMQLSRNISTLAENSNFISKLLE